MRSSFSQFLLEVARQKNQTPLPLIKPYAGPRLPPDRYCLTAPNYRLKSLQKKVWLLIREALMMEIKRVCCVYVHVCV